MFAGDVRGSEALESGGFLIGLIQKLIQPQVLVWNDSTDYHHVIKVAQQGVFGWYIKNLSAVNSYVLLISPERSPVHI